MPGGAGGAGRQNSAETSPTTVSLKTAASIGGFAELEFSPASAPYVERGGFESGSDALKPTDEVQRLPK
ncbi:hypothetical protein IOCL1545_000079900 [Leishmania shawi]|uniref:Uncharacterized protein n=1 Tax=Leishmania shawi TaxID=5680 RepID=A0ABR3EFQ9_9TRYP